MTARDLDKLGTAGYIEKLLAKTAGTKVYISVDIDVLDPSYAPATGTSVSTCPTQSMSRNIADVPTGARRIHNARAIDHPRWPERD